MSTIKIFLNIPKDDFFSQIFFFDFLFENYILFTNYIISVKDAMVLW